MTTGETFKTLVAGRRLTWMSVHYEMAVVRRGDKHLMVSVIPSGDTFFALAIESDAPPPGSCNVRAAQDQFLDTHAHQTIGTAPTYTGAIRIAERYARSWKKSDVTHERCGCGDIGIQTPSSASRRIPNPAGESARPALTAGESIQSVLDELYR